MSHKELAIPEGTVGSVFDNPTVLDFAMKLIATNGSVPGVRLLDQSAMDAAYPDIEVDLSPLDVESAGINLSFAMLTNHDRKAGWVTGIWSLQRLNKTTGPLARGLPWPSCRDLFLFRHASEFGNVRKVVGWNQSRSRWISANRRDDIFFSSDSDYGQLRAVPGLLFAERYRWKARLLHGHGHFVLPTDPRGALKFFRDRDAYPGERRAALLHFVRSHRRALPDETTTEVMRHLRGVRSFSWNGWQATLSESDFERETSNASRNN